ncbi:MAG TPA: hypothetical protein VK890_11900 [Bacteroidia bacterium]|jgi:hypothetical protein|nr:hypothetical protein [Bacteroidia bacterium]
MILRACHKLFFTGLIFGSLTVSAQQINSRGSNQKSTDTALNRLLGNKKDTVMTHKILLIPFEPKMLMSEIGKEVNAKTHLTYAGITQEMRKELDLAMFGALRRSCVTVSLLDGKQKSDSTLAYIYGSTSYSYDIVPGTTPDAGSKDKTTAKGQYIKNGQLEVPVDYSQRFMNVSILNPKLLTDLSTQYHTDTYVFINELDIKNVDNNSTNLSDETYRREVTVHYSVVDNTGHYISKGVATTYFPYSENDPKEIGEKYFSLVGRLILKNYVDGLNKDKLALQQKKGQSKQN